jgi:hypothetical protein
VVALLVAWVGAVLNSANLPSKIWCLLLPVVGLLGLVFLAPLAYVIAGPDGTEILAARRLRFEAQDVNVAGVSPPVPFQTSTVGSCRRRWAPAGRVPRPGPS